jgi:inhibitor of cysteine peptidase
LFLDARKALAVRDEGLRVVTDGDNGNTIAIFAGKKLIVELLSNGTTGYSWQVVENNTALLSLTGHEYIIPDYPSGFCGGGGVERFEFYCRKGSSRLKLVYQRSFAPKADDKMYSIVVNAKANK